MIYLISNFAGQHQLLLPFWLFEARLTTLHSNHFNCSRAGIIAQTTGEVLPPFNSKQCPGTIEDGINKGISGLVSANSGISLISIAGSLPGQIKAMLTVPDSFQNTNSINGFRGLFGLNRAII
ncbi:MAG: hypothetical protein VB959_17070 [Rhodospirillales bacterium]